MPLQVQGFGNVVADVGGTGFRAIKVSPMPIEIGALGFYQISMTSGTLAAALAASAVLFTFRWGDATRLAVVTSIKAVFKPLTLFTAATATDFGFDAVVGRSYSASYTGGTQGTLTGNSMKTRTSQGTALVTDLRMATTTGLTVGTITLDGNAFTSSIGYPQRINPVAATEELLQSIPVIDWSADIANGGHPLVFAQNEGFVIRNRAAWPAAGTGIFQAEVRWAGVTAY